ncbi:MAG: DUF1830 domain-containing protein [Synechococcaceae cyanobacterium]|nr:DUF1830 domain-containing protein [Synechococcaceae cyanobacterium]
MANYLLSRYGVSLDRTHPATLDRSEPAPSGIEPFGAEGIEHLDCGYRNASQRMVIVRCCGPAAFYLERVVFPFELLSFRCPPGSEVEIWTHGLGGAELLEAAAAEELTLQPGREALAALADEAGASPWWAAASDPVAIDP